ncbi:MAG TPA: cation:proton antiporter family protein [Balneolaceae bacterium]|nr:cation:proton antiporter family protein [Balneolaceae bacterium]
MDIIWIGMAFILGMVVSRIKLPPLVGYLAAGALLSAGGYVVSPDLHEIAHLGVLFLLFTVGLHLRLKNIFRLEVLGTGVIHLLISTSFFYPIAILLGYGVSASLIIGILLGFSSTVLTAKNLEYRNELGAFHGRIAIGILLFQDLVAIILLGITGGSQPSIWGLLLLGLPILSPIFKKLLTLIKEDELKLLFGLLLALGGGATFENLGLSSELGALVAGMLLSEYKVGEDLSKKLWALKEVFLVGFFLEIGLTGLPGKHDFFLAIIALALLPVKSFFFFGLMLFFKLRARTSFITTISLSSYSEFALIAGSVAASSGLLPASIVVAFAVLTAVSFALNATLVIWEETLWKYVEPMLAKYERDIRHPDEQIISLGSAKFLVVGMGNAGIAAYDFLKKRDKPVVGMDIDPARIEQNLTEGRRVIYGDMQDQDLWQQLDLTQLESVMLAIGTTDSKINAAKHLRSSNYNGTIVALTMQETDRQALIAAGTSAVCLPIAEAGKKLAELSLSERTNSPASAFPANSSSKE